MLDGTKSTLANPGQDHMAKTSLDDVDAGILAPEEGEWTDGIEYVYTQSWP